MRLFVFACGERHEGHTPRSIHLTLDGAQAAACSQWERDLSRFWEEQGDGALRQWRASVNGIDEAWILEMEVLP